MNTIKLIIFSALFFSFSDKSAKAASFDPHGEREYLLVENSPACVSFTKDERFFKIKNTCDSEKIGIYRIISNGNIFIEIYKLEPNKTKLYLLSYSLWYNLYDKATIDTTCGDGVSDFLLAPRSMYEGAIGDQLHYLKGYEDFFAFTTNNPQIKFYCHRENIRKSSK